MVRTLHDLLAPCYAEIRQDIAVQPSAAFVLGSYLYQDLETPLAAFPSLEAALDRTPDFLVAVPHLEEALTALARRRAWGTPCLEKMLRLRKDSPFYFNLTTFDAQALEGNRTEQRRLPYKLGLIEETSLLTLSTIQDYNLYLLCRLSKPVCLLDSDPALRPRIQQELDQGRDAFLSLTLSTLPKVFTGEDVHRRYLQVSYLAEAYRLFDWFKNKPRQLFDGPYYDMERKRTMPFRTKLTHLLGPRLFAHPHLTSTLSGKFLTTSFTQEKTAPLLPVLYDFLRFNLTSAAIACHKNRITNAIGGASNLRYLLRKFR